MKEKAQDSPDQLVTCWEAMEGKGSGIIYSTQAIVVNAAF